MTDPEKNPKPKILNRVFTCIETLTYHRPLWVIAGSLLLAGLSIVYTLNNLGFKTSRLDLISHDLEFQVLYQQYRQQFEDFDGMIVVVEGDDPEPMKNFAEALVEKLNTRREVFSQIYYKVDTEYFKNKSLLYLEKNELQDLAEKLQSHQGFLETVNRSPGLNTLLRSINQEISVGMVDSLLTDFLGTDEDEEETADLSLLIALLKQMSVHLAGDTRYRSPWNAFLNQEDNPLESKGYLVSDNGKLLFMLLNPMETKGDFSASKGAIEIIRGMIAELKPNFPKVQVGLTGGEVISSDEMFTTHQDALKASKYALVGVALLFILFYRGVVKPLLAVFTLLVGIAWALGYTTVSVGHLNIISVVFTTILIGLGIDFGIHILCRYREERRLGRDSFSAMQATLQHTGRGNVAGAITTAIAFGAMSFTSFVGIIELGIIAAGGVLLCLLAMVLVLPSLINLEERWRKPVYVMPPRVTQRENLSEQIYSHFNVIIVICLAVLVGAGVLARDLRFDYNLLNMQAKGIEAVEYEMKIINNAKRASWNAAVIADTLDEAKEKYKAIKNLPTVGKIESILSAVPADQDDRILEIKEIAPLLDGLKVASKDENFSLAALNHTLDNIRFKLRKKEKAGIDDDVFTASDLARRLTDALNQTAPTLATTRLSQFSQKLFVDYRSKMADLKRSSHPTPVTIKGLPGDLKKRFMSDDGKFLLLVYPNINIWEREAMENFLFEMREIHPTITGNAVHMFEASRLMIDGYIRAGVYALIAIIIYLLITLRNLLATILVLLPTLAGAVLTAGLMALIDIQFNMANLVILPLILGIGVVDGVHIVHRYREQADSGTNVISKSTGQAVLLTSLTTMIGFGCLMVADHQGVYSLGVVLTLGVGSCLVTSVTLLPALMKLAWHRNWHL